MLIKKMSAVIITLLALSQVGCSTKNGSVSLSSDYVYPNSNVIPIKIVKVSKSYNSIVIPPMFEKEQYYELKEELMQQVPEADIITDLKYETDTVQWIPLPYIGLLSPYTMTVTMTGMASTMETGEQELN